MREQGLYACQPRPYRITTLRDETAAPTITDHVRRDFTAARRSVRTGLTGTVSLATALHRAISEILHSLLPQRRLRANARVVRRKMSK